MKITRKQLRRLIIEAARTIIVDPEGVATPADRAYRSGLDKDKQISQMHPKLASLMSGPADDRRAARQLADVLPLDDESLRPEPLSSTEERAVDDLGEKSLEQDDPVQYGLSATDDKILKLIDHGARRMLKKLGVKYVSEHGYKYSQKDLNNAALALGCSPNDIAYTEQYTPLQNTLLAKIVDLIPRLGSSTSGFSHQSVQGGILYDINGTKLFLKKALHFKG